MNQFYYSGQIRRFLIQFIRAMSGFQVIMGQNEFGVMSYQQVPVIYGDSSRQVAQILRGNSENVMSSVPAMSITISGLAYDRNRVLNPTFVDKVQVHERKYDHTTKEYTNLLGDSFTVERLMPVPYTLGITLDIWTSSTEQKLQLVEQIVTIFNPALEIQNTDNFLDWTSLSAIFLKDTKWTSRAVPTGIDESIDVATLTFELPIWLSTPAKVKKLGVIHKIINDMYDTTNHTMNDPANGHYPGHLSPDIIDLANSGIMTRRAITPMSVNILYLGNTLKLLKSGDIVQSDNSTKINLNKDIHPKSWNELMNLYGELKNGITQVRLYQPATNSDVIGTVAYHPTDNTLLLFSPFADTLPTNNVSPVNAIIDPFTVTVGPSILSPTVGYRFLILDDIGSVTNSVGAIAWRGSDNVDLIAKKNDIIEYTGSRWIVSFNAASTSSVKYMINLNNNIQYKFIDNQWVKSVEGHYTDGTWRIVL